MSKVAEIIRDTDLPRNARRWYALAAVCARRGDFGRANGFLQAAEYEEAAVFGEAHGGEELLDALEAEGIDPDDIRDADTGWGVTEYTWLILRGFEDRVLGRD